MTHFRGGKIIFLSLSSSLSCTYVPCNASTSIVFPTAAWALLSSKSDTNTFATSTLVILPTAISPWLNIGLGEERGEEREGDKRGKTERETDEKRERERER